MRSSKIRSHRFLIALVLLLSASALLVAASSAANNRPILGDPNEVYDARIVLFHNAKIDTRLSPQFHQEPHLFANSDNNVDKSNSVNQYLLHVDETLSLEQRKSIEDTLGAPLIKYLPHNTWHIMTTPTTATALQSLSGVHWVGHYHPKYKLHINLIEGNHNLKLAKYKPIMAKLLEAAAGATNMTHADKKLLAHHFSHLSASSVHPEGTILGLNPFELYAVLPKWNEDIGAVENLAAAFTERLQKDHAALAERVKITAGSGDLLEGSCKNEADVQALADFFTAQSETYMVTRKSIQRVHNRWARGVAQSNLGNPSYDANGAATSVSISQSKGLFGQNQVIGVSDSGLDWQSCFFHDTAFPAGPSFYTVNAQTVATPTAASVNANHRKVIQYVAWADRLDENGHGTHVSGSVAGKLYTANNAYAPNNGMSQEAKLAFFDIGIGTAGSLTVPNNYDRTLFPWARVAGAFIHSNSWGSADNTYTIDASWVDTYMWQNKDFLVLVAAGNDGNLPNTIGAPATAKNIVTVGASTNSKEGWEGMFCATGYNLNTGLCNVGRQFGTTSYDKQHIAGFSSVGPTRDGRLKPEVAAPGMFILSAKNRQTASTSCTAAAGTLMTFNAGTSMATPVTAGDVGIIRQWFTEGYYPSGLKNTADSFIPSASLMKAMLISGSRMLDRYGGTVDAGGFLFSNTATQPTPVPLAAAPGMVQGYGRVEIDNSIYFQGQTSPHKTIVLGLSAVANGRRTEPQFTTTGQAAQTYKMCIQSVSLEVPVRIALVWTDAPGQPNAANPLVNNLDLSVAAKGQTYLGNSKANVAGGSADIRNPSEVVTFDERSAFTAKTDITISVAATRISLGPQPYTLVVTGDVTEGDCTAATAAPAETFVWVAENFGACSAECTTPGQPSPTQTRKVTCVGSINGPTTDETKCAGKQKPATIQACNTHSCGTTTYEYVVGQWSACSKTCGGGTQTRPVTCQSIQTGTVVDESNCGDHTKPATEQPCNTQACIGSTSAPKNAAEWKVGDCSTCSAQCTCTREVTCYYYGVKVSDYLCAPENGGPAMKPPTTTTCTGGQCPTTNPTNAPVETFAWAASDWGACSVGCTKAGSTGGIQTRTIKCRSSMGYDTADNRCAASPRPAAASACNLDPCPDTTTVKRDFNHQWLMGGWGRCDATTKTQSRWVICATTNGDNADSAKCEGHAGIKPATTRACTALTPYDSMTVAQRDNSVAYTWYAERYGDPTTWCGGNGQIYRYAWCLGTDGKVADTRARCNAATKPAEVDKCLQCDRPCVAEARWVPGEYFMGCSTIDPCCGVEHRHAFCIDANGQKIADTTACGGKGTEQEYFYQTPCTQCPGGNKTKCGAYPKGLYPDRGDGPALPGSKVPGAATMPANGPNGAQTTPPPSARVTYIRMQANGLRLTGALTTEEGLKAFLVDRIATYLQVASTTLQATYFRRTGPDDNARVVIIVAVPDTNTAKSLLSDLDNPDGDIRTALGEVAPSNEVEAVQTDSPNDDVAAASDSSSMSGSTMTVIIAAGASAVALLGLVGGYYLWQKQKANAVRTTAKMGADTAY